MMQFLSRLNEYIEEQNLADNYEVKDHGGYGPSLFAKKEFAIGDVVVFEHAKYVTTSDLFGSFQSAVTIDELDSLFKTEADVSDFEVKVSMNKVASDQLSRFKRLVRDCIEGCTLMCPKCSYGHECKGVQHKIHCCEADLCRRCHLFFIFSWQ